MTETTKRADTADSATPDDMSANGGAGSHGGSRHDDIVRLLCDSRAISLPERGGDPLGIDGLHGRYDA